MLTIIIIGLISLSSFLKETAWIYLGFAGTTASLVLSVLAIIITLVDVAGQKQQVYDISNSARQLKKLIAKQRKENKNLKEEIQGRLNAESLNDIDQVRTYMKQFIESENVNKTEVLNKISKIHDDLDIKLNRLKKLNTNKSGGKNMKIKEYYVRKNITDEELETFKHDESNEVFEIHNIWIERLEDKEFDILKIESSASDLRLSDLVVIVQAEFHI